MPEQPNQRKTAGQVLDTGLDLTKRLAKPAARRWASLSGRGKVLVVCGSFAVVVLLALGIGGLSHNPGDKAHSVESGGPNNYPEPDAKDPRMAEAYEIQKRLARDYLTSHPFANRWWFGNNVQFSPPTDTRIVRDGNYFRVRGMVMFTASDSHSHEQFCYVLEMTLDPELDVWNLVGDVKQVRY